MATIASYSICSLSLKTQNVVAGDPTRIVHPTRFSVGSSGSGFFQNGLSLKSSSSSFQVVKKSHSCVSIKVRAASGKTLYDFSVKVCIYLWVYIYHCLALVMESSSWSWKFVYIFMQDIDGKDVSLSKFKGKVALIVNVASKWYFLLTL